VTASAHLANTHSEFPKGFRVTELVLLEAVMGLVTVAGHAIVRMVPVVSELLNLIENVSPDASVNADP
jgi:hypothetical protein